MKKDTLVSIIVPVLNSGLFLEDCLTSIENQSYSNLEILIVDDNSSDESTDIAKRWVAKDSRFKIIERNTTGGPGVARNDGVTFANGSYLFFIDSDDYIENTCIELLMAHASEHDDVIVGTVQHTHLSLNGVAKRPTGDAVALRSAEWKKENVLGVLFTKELFVSKGFSFSTRLLYCEWEILFMLAGNFTKVYVPGATYYKRKRNDPILNPSLFQSNTVDSVVVFLELYLADRPKFLRDSPEQRYVDRFFIKRLKKSILPKLRRKTFSENNFAKASRACKHLSTSRILKSEGYRFKFLIKILKSNSPLVFSFIYKNWRRVRKGASLLRNKQKFFAQCSRSLFVKLPVAKKKVVFESFLGRNYSDNPKAIYERMLELDSNYRFVWIFDDTNRDIPGNPLLVRRFSLAHYYHLATAKYWVTNTRVPKRFAKHKDTTYLQTWHGTPLKKLVHDLHDVVSADPNHKRDFYRQSRKWDYLISPNPYSSEVFRRAFQYRNPMLECGYPRNDVLINSSVNRTSHLRRSLGLPEDKKIVLYAPTWRDNQFISKGKYTFSLELDLDLFQKSLSHEYIVITRLHYHVSNSLDLSKYEGFVYDFSAYDDIADLYLVSDLLITDYSSVFFDYANTKKPILFYTYDLDEYRDSLRGLYLDFETEAPGPLLLSTTEVVDSIKNLEYVNQTYADKYLHFRNKYCIWEDGTATDKVIKEVFY